MELFSFVDPVCFSTDLAGKHMEEIIGELADLAVRSDKAKKLGAQKIADLLLARENQGTTGFGNEIAIPHARIPDMDEFLIYVGISRNGADYHAIDKKKVKIFFVILGPSEKANEYVQILAALSRAISQTGMKQELLSARSEEPLVEALLRNTRAVGENASERPKMKLMYVILYLEDMLYHILEYFIQEGIEGATIVDSSGMGEYISSAPLFANFIGFFNEKKNHSKTIMVMIPADKEQEIIAGMEEITGDMDKRDGAMVMTIDVSSYKGTMKMM